MTDPPDDEIDNPIDNYPDLRTEPSLICEAIEEAGLRGTYLSPEELLIVAMQTTTKDDQYRSPDAKAKDAAGKAKAEELNLKDYKILNPEFAGAALGLMFMTEGTYEALRKDTDWKAVSCMSNLLWIGIYMSADYNAAPPTFKEAMDECKGCVYTPQDYVYDAEKAGERIGSRNTRGAIARSPNQMKKIMTNGEQYLRDSALLKEYAASDLVPTVSKAEAYKLAIKRHEVWKENSKEKEESSTTLATVERKKAAAALPDPW